MTLQVNKYVLIIGLVGLLVIGYWFAQNQSAQVNLVAEQTKIQKEAHLLAIYAEYKNNMDGCKQAALSQEKDEAFIKVNCVKAINSSLIGELLKGWGRNDLLVTE